MCEIIEFPRKKAKQKPKISKDSGRASKILFFYGVRYSRVTNAEQISVNPSDLVTS